MLHRNAVNDCVEEIPNFYFSLQRLYGYRESSSCSSSLNDKAERLSSASKMVIFNKWSYPKFSVSHVAARTSHRQRRAARAQLSAGVLVAKLGSPGSLEIVFRDNKKARLPFRNVTPTSARAAGSARGGGPVSPVIEMKIFWRTGSVGFLSTRQPHGSAVFQPRPRGALGTMRGAPEGQTPSLPPPEQRA